MTKPIHRRSSRLCDLFVALSILVTSGYVFSEAHAKEGKKMKAVELTWWQAVDALVKQIPFSKKKVETLLKTSLSETDNTGNDVFQFYESPPVTLKDGVVIRNVDLRIKRAGPHPGFMVLEIEGQCVTLDQIRRRYGPLEITETPHGHSLDEETSHSVVRPWGKLSFGFAERNPDCLASIVFDPKTST